MIRLRISVRTAATLLGMRIAAGPDRASDPDPAEIETARPDWRAELDRLETAGEPTLSPYAELEEVLEARIAGPETAGSAPTPAVGARCGSRPRGPQGDLRRRGRCPKTRR